MGTKRIEVISDTVAKIDEKIVFFYCCTTGCFEYIHLRNDENDPGVVSGLTSDKTLIIELDKEVFSRKDLHIYNSCRTCGEPVISKDPRQKYCSVYCRQEYARLSKRAKAMQIDQSGVYHIGYYSILVDGGRVVVSDRGKSCRLAKETVQGKTEFYNWFYGVHRPAFACVDESLKVLIPSKDCKRRFLLFAKIFIEARGVE